MYPDALAMEVEIDYLPKHGQAKRLNYVEYRNFGIPLGSGAIGGSIRRVINTRLKNNGKFWLEDNAERRKANELGGRVWQTTGSGCV